MHGLLDYGFNLLTMVLFPLFIDVVWKQEPLLMETDNCLKGPQTPNKLSHRKTKFILHLSILNALKSR